MLTVQNDRHGPICEARIINQGTPAACCVRSSYQSHFRVVYIGLERGHMVRQLYSLEHARLATMLCKVKDKTTFSLSHTYNVCLSAHSKQACLECLRISCYK